MQFRVYSLFLALIFSVLFISCKEKKTEDVIVEETPVAMGKVTLSFNPLWHGDEFVMQQVYNDDFGNRIRIDKFMHYISFLRMIKDDGTEVQLKDFDLLSFYEDETFTFDVPAGNYTKVKFGIGVPEEYNEGQDPAQYANSHALSVAGSQGMFWTWNTGYIFVKFEGMCDTTGTEGAELLSPIAIHIGEDVMFRRYSTEDMVIQVVAGETKNLAVNVHVDEILATGGATDIDLATDAATHTSNNMVLATTFMDNYLDAITVE